MGTFIVEHKHLHPAHRIKTTETPTHCRGRQPLHACLFGWSVGFLTSSSTLGYIADGPQDKASDNFTCCHT